MTLRSSFKHASTLAKATTILAIIFLVSAGLCGYEVLNPSAGHRIFDEVLGIAILIGMIGSTVGLIGIGIIAIINYFRRSITGKEPPP